MVQSIRTLLIVGIVIGLAPGSMEAADKPSALVRGAEFHVAWNQGVKARLDQTPLRSVMEQLCSSRRIAWVIDRRLDPDQNMSCPLTAAPLSEFLPQLLETIQADVVVLGSTVIVGPQTSIRELRSLAEIQRVALQKSGITAQRKLALGRQAELHWEELAEPRQLAAQLAQRAMLDLAGAELIPYDLWGSGDLVGMTPGEALTVIAGQFELQLKWESDGQATLIAQQDPVCVTREIKIPEAKRDAAKSQFPELAWTVEGKTVQATGLVEELEALERWLKGGPKPKLRTKQPAPDWRTRTFRLKVKNSSLADVLQALQQQGIPIEWDEEALVAAGVDFTTPLQIELQDASADELLSALCKPTKLRYEMTAQGAKILPPRP